jgi:hypothetical protein
MYQLLGVMPRCAVALAEICGLGVVYTQPDIDGGFTECDYVSLMSTARVDEAAFEGMRAVAVAAARSGWEV